MKKKEKKGIDLAFIGLIAVILATSYLAGIALTAGTHLYLYLFGFIN